MLTDLLLAIIHHLLVFALLAILVIEMMTLRPDISGAAVLRLGRIDAAFGVLAGLIVIVGFSRVYFGSKGADFYLHNWVFWAKIAAFVLVGLLSILPTVRIIQWGRAARADASYRPPGADVIAVKRLMHYEAFVFFLIPIFAAAMARGYGL